MASDLLSQLASEELPCRMSAGYAKTTHCPVILITWATLAATLTALWHYHPSLSHRLVRSHRSV